MNQSEMLLAIATALSNGAELLVVEDTHVVINNVEIIMTCGIPLQEKFLKVGRLYNYEPGTLCNHKKVYWFDIRDIKSITAL